MNDLRFLLITNSGNFHYAKAIDYNNIKTGYTVLPVDSKVFGDILYIRTLCYVPLFMGVLREEE